jgi:DNA-binding protein H-NS
MTQMTSLQIRDQIKSLEKKALELKAAEVQGVIARIQKAIEYYELKPIDLFTAGALGRGSRSKAANTPEAADSAEPAPRKTTKGRKLPPKFSDKKGNVWSGRGTMPRWLAAEIAAGKTVQDFAV